VRLFIAYRVLAIAVGVLLAFCSLVSFPLEHFAAQGGSLQDFGAKTAIVWVAHGWAFMIYVVVTFFLSRKLGWSIPFTVLALAAGLIPLVIFWVERHVVARARAEHPELARS
jgi:integral membrane protein